MNLEYFTDIVIKGWGCWIVIILPLLFTCYNIYNCVVRRPIAEKVISACTIIFGAIWYSVLHFAAIRCSGDWNVPLYSYQFHNTISSHYAGILLLVPLGIIAYCILLFVRADKLPPLVSAILIAFLILFNLFQIVYAIQLFKNNLSILYLYNFNVLLLSARVIYLHMMQLLAMFKGRAVSMEQHLAFKKVYGIIDSLSKYTFLIFVILFFVIAILEIIFVLTGQGLDAPIKAFTDTADWTFSQQIPPPPSTYDGHYLCTVASGGHKKVVKPLRLGTRRGQTIVVNRQLCIANAFEEVIQEKFPKFHKWIRHVYDTYGYPLSQKITSPARADVVYFIMKPLEWIFLLFLYLVDLRPEQRIRRQYPYKK